jgi:hypothetical protein
MLRPDTCAFRENNLTGFDVFTLLANIISRIVTDKSNRPVRGIFGKLNHNDTIGTLRHCGACHDFCTLIRFYRFRGRISRSNSFNHLKLIGQISPSAGVAVHCRFVEWRHVHIRFGILS